MIYFNLIGSFVFTKDITDLKEVKTVNTYEFIKEIRNRLQ